MGCPGVITRKDSALLRPGFQAYICSAFLSFEGIHRHFRAITVDSIGLLEWLGCAIGLLWIVYPRNGNNVETLISVQ